MNAKGLNMWKVSPSSDRGYTSRPGGMPMALTIAFFNVFVIVVLLMCSVIRGGFLWVLICTHLR